MKNNVHFYVEPKNGFVLLMTLLLSASAVSRVLLFSMNAIPGNVWWRVVLPVAATALYILIALCQGREQFYKTAIPVWLLALFAAIWVKESLGSRALVWLLWISLFFFAFLYYGCGLRPAGPPGVASVPHYAAAADRYLLL